MQSRGQTGLIGFKGLGLDKVSNLLTAYEKNVQIII